MHLKTDTATSNAHFAAVPTIRRSRNGFSVARKHVTTMKFDYLFPLYWRFTYPGDTFNLTASVMARLTTQVLPLFDDLYFDMHAWYVPLRLVQTNWSRLQFNDQPAGPSQDNSSLTTPKIDLAALGAGGFTSKSLYDYLGYPTKVNLSANVQHINNYAARAYNLIWNQNYRDQNLQNPVTVDLGDGPDTASNYVLLQRGRRHDKFTSCLTAAQKGTPVTIPLGTTAPLIRINNAAKSPLYQDGNNTPLGTGALSAVATSGNDYINTGGFNASVDVSGSNQVDLTNATAATVNQWRNSLAIQHLLEADARGGTRDIEAIQNRWGVTVPDFRVQRAEYLGGTTFTFDGHIVPQTSATSGSNYQGGLTQFSQSMSALRIAHSFPEHGVFMILISARSNITYQQGLDRELSYKTRYDWYQPEFANIGEVAVLTKEIYCSSNDTTNQTTFGFQEYGYQIRYQDNIVTGEMRSNFTTPRDSQHMADNYGSAPTLGSAWIVSTTPIDRSITVATATADPIQINSLVSGMAARTAPMYSIPGLARL